MTMLLSALCADQVVMAEGLIRPQALMEALEGVAGRLISEEQRRQPAPTRSPQPARRWSDAQALPVVAVWRVHPAESQLQFLHLPPPVL
jgi:hypothetical protein